MHLAAPGGGGAILECRSIYAMLPYLCVEFLLMMPPENQRRDTRDTWWANALMLRLWSRPKLETFYDFCILYLKYIRARMQSWWCGGDVTIHFAGCYAVGSYKDPGNYSGRYREHVGPKTGEPDFSESAGGNVFGIYFIFHWVQNLCIHIEYVLIGIIFWAWFG